MKFLHLADLHLGKKLGEYDLCDVQKDMLDKLVNLCLTKGLPVIAISGDVYDTRDPSVAATSLLDHFLAQCNRNSINVVMIPGNHDQADKLHFGSEIFKENHIYITTDVSESLKPITIDDVNFYLLPFVNKYDIKNAFPELKDIKTNDYDSLQNCLSYVINKMKIDKCKKNVLLAHQSVLGSKEKKLYPSGSEVSLDIDIDGSIGGEDIVSSSIFKDFNYVALGHIHKMMNVEDNMRYPGALLKYHKDEANNKKSFTIVDTRDFSIEEVEIKPLRDVVVLNDDFESLKKEVQYKDDYVYFVLNDKEYIQDPMAKLKTIFKYPVSISYNSTKSNSYTNNKYEDVEQISKLDLFKDLYKSQKSENLSNEQEEIVKDIIKEVWGE